MLVGREREQARIAELLGNARAGRSGALLLRGEAGIGKTALLEHAAAEAVAHGLRVVRALGVESEAELELSGLLELCRPLLDRLDAIPARQADALRGALGLAAPVTEASDRFTVGAATLSLLAAAAEDTPLLAIVDDAQWLDRSSQDAITFAARRLQADAVVVLFAVRDGEERSFAAPGIDTLVLEGLVPSAAGELLAATGVTPSVAARLHAATGGNPLALLELPALLSADQLAGSEPLAEPLPAATTAEQAFVRRIAALPEATRTALLVAAVATRPELEPILRALDALGVAPELAPAEDAGLVDVGDARIVVRHPLVRSAVYHAASASQLRAVHRALAEALTAPADADQRAWHLAGAAVGPDEQVAAALAAAAESAGGRSGYAAAAAALDRAARLTPAGDLRARRLLTAAHAAWLAGRGERACELVAETLALTAAAGGADSLHGEALRLHGAIEYFAGRATAGSALLLEAAEALASTDTLAAVSAAADAVNASIPAADPATMLRAAERARALAPDDGSAADFEASIALGYALCFNGRVGEGEPLVRRGADLFTARTGVTSPLQVGRLAWALGWLGRHREAQAHVTGTIGLARGTGAVASLPYLLAASTWHSVHTGRWSEAYADCAEALDLAEQIGQPLPIAQGLSLLVWLHALRGDEDACRARAEQARARGGAEGLRLYELLVHLGLGLLQAGADRWEAAIAPLETAAEGASSFYVAGIAPALELAEAYARVGRTDAAEARLTAFDCSELRTVPLQAALATRVRGLLADSDTFEDRFRAALDLHAQCDYPFALARTQLCFGERLRRAGRRVDAREQLRAALATFEQLGAEPWAERARRELSASGETLRRRDAETRDELTPRELQIALQVAEGKTNKDVGAALFLSPKTVEYHLKHVFQKRDVRSRAELIRQFAAQQ